ncbi:hypothetical protein [Rhizobium mongolense]|uniref:Uncharacterized protein n=2 Tax=Rhizobium mongolense TaxID=57676 RepID=A0ABR6IM17_9HYPH|nr:hypothetical protein [Rhizobium mongolense]MBB4228589.1 hypothetical protein [Rhizobium mongolense]TVZ63810.1 hypothetical protein BCL32_3985 [Rhizobium mongolense USDA 1844]
MNNIPDLMASAKTVHARYSAGRMGRETVREWIGRLGAYDGPTGDRVREAAEWFRANKSEPVSEEIRRTDLERIAAIFAP